MSKILYEAPCRIGDKVYEICDPLDEGDVIHVEELTVTEVATKRIFCSAYVPPEEDIDYEIPIEKLGKSVFLSKEQAVATLKKMKIMEEKMKNYLCHNGEKIELTEEQAQQIRSSVRAKSHLGDIDVGETFKIAEYEFIVLEQGDGITKVLLKDCLCTSAFSENGCNFEDSKVENILKEFGDKMVDIIGVDNIIEHLVDLTSNDGLKDYGSRTELVSLLTTELYRRYVLTIDKYKLNKWWWLVTPWSTSAHGCDEYVCCVSPSGNICSGNYNDGDLGVRPFCILKSDIFVS